MVFHHCQGAVCYRKCPLQDQRSDFLVLGSHQSLNPKALGCFTRVLVQCILFCRISAALLKSPRLGQKKLISAVLEKAPI